MLLGYLLGYKSSHICQNPQKYSILPQEMYFIIYNLFHYVNDYLELSCVVENASSPDFIYILQVMYLHHTLSSPANPGKRLKKCISIF